MRWSLTVLHGRKNPPSERLPGLNGRSDRTIYGDSRGPELFLSLGDARPRLR